MIETSSPGDLSPTATLILIALVLIGLASAFGWALHGWRTQRQRAAAALARVTTSAPPARGSVVLRGVVETAQPDRPAITVALWELGEETSTKNGTMHTWTEQSREVRAEPFDLWLEGGVVVRVEPDEDVFLVDALDSIETGNPRTRRAELTNGETAYVSGVIGRGRHGRVNPEPRADAGGSAYRDGPVEGPVLRAGRDRMLVSTEPLDKRYLKAAKVHRLFTALFALALTLSTTVLCGPALVTELFGHVVEARAISRRHWTTSAKRGVVHHYGVTTRYTSAAGRDVDLVFEVPQEIYDGVAEQRFDRLAIVIAFDNPTFSSLGTRATIAAGYGIWGFFGAATLVLAYVMALRNAREWYDKRRVVTRGVGPIVF